MTTLRKLIKGSMRLINVLGTGEEPTADDMNVSMKSLNGLVQSMGNDILNIYTVQPYYFPLTPGKQHYTLGPAVDSKGEVQAVDWAITRPMRIEQARLLLYPSITYPTPPGPPPPPPSEYVQFLALTMYNGFSTTPDYGALAQDGLTYISLGPVGGNAAAQTWSEPQTDLSTPQNEWDLMYADAFGYFALQSKIKFALGTDEAPLPHPKGTVINGTPTEFQQPSLSQSVAFVPAKAGDKVFLRENIFNFPGEIQGGPNKYFEATFVVGPDAFNGDLYRLVSYYTGLPTGGQVAVEHWTQQWYDFYNVTPRS